MHRLVCQDHGEIIVDPILSRQGWIGENEVESENRGSTTTNTIRVRTRSVGAAVAT